MNNVNQTHELLTGWNKINLCICSVLTDQFELCLNSPDNQIQPDILTGWIERVRKIPPDLEGITWINTGYDLNSHQLNTMIKTTGGLCAALSQQCRAIALAYQKGPLNGLLCQLKDLAENTNEIVRNVESALINLPQLPGFTDATALHQLLFDNAEAKRRIENKQIDEAIK